MIKKVMIALAAFALLGSAIPALAQESRPMNLSIRAGGFWPGSEAGRDQANTWLLIGGEFKLQDMPVSPTSPEYAAMLTLSADWIQGGDFRVVPVMLNYVGSRNEWFYSVGAGFSFADFDGNDDQLFTWSAGFGYNFQQGMTPAFLEAKYFQTNNRRGNGVAVSVGVRL